MVNIPKIVKNLVKKYETIDPFKLCYYLGIIVLYKDLGETKGYFEKILGKKVIVLNEKLDEFSMRVVLAHELGHALLHSSKYVQFMQSYSLLPKTSLLENEANKFAAELLINEKIEDYEYHYNCSIDIKILNRLQELKYEKQNKWRYRYW